MQSEFNQGQSSETQAFLVRTATQTTQQRRLAGRDTVDHLRILFVTCTPSDPRTQQRLRLLSRSLRRDGHAILVCVPKGSLSPEHAAEADAASVEYIFLRQHSGAFTSALGSWATLLDRFHPTHVHLSADVPPSFALRLATITHMRSRRRVPVLVEIDDRLMRTLDGRVTRVIDESVTRTIDESLVRITDEQSIRIKDGRSAASKRRAETRYWIMLCRKRATQLLCSDRETFLWSRKMLQLPAFRLSLIRHNSLVADEGRRLPVLLVANQWKSSAHSGVPVLVGLLLPLLLGEEPLRIIAPVSMRRHLQRSLANSSAEIRGRLTYVKNFAEWLSRLGESTAVVGISHPSEVNRAIGAAQACDVPVILVARAHDSPPLRVDGISVVHGEYPQELIDTVRLIDADARAGAGFTHMCTSPGELAAEVEHLRHIYEAVHLRERKQ